MFGYIILQRGRPEQCVVEGEASIRPMLRAERVYHTKK